MTKTRKSILIVWALSIAGIVVLSQIEAGLSAAGIDLWITGVLKFFCWLTAIALSTWIAAIFVSWILRKLFWRVGRRLALSYLLIGLMPFFLFAVLLLLVGYIAAGVLSQNSFRADRQATLSRLDQANLEYALTGSPPGDGLSTLEIYDSRKGTTAELPEWLREGTFIGLVRRGERGAVFVAARNYKLENGTREVVFAQPADREWEKDVETDRNVVIWRSMAEESGPGNFNVTSSDDVDSNANEKKEDEEIKEILAGLIHLEGVVWWDISSELLDWDQGEITDERFFIVLLNPWRNLLEYYFGSPEYFDMLLGIVAGTAALLAFIYLLAALLAAAMIYSISSAVNRIEKGTKAVERGDFSYRIGLQRRNQLGDVATSFDRMTESISSLLSKVAEQERLQSEIDIAATIQRNLLPKEGPSFRGVTFAAHFEPTASIGGDYYDVFKLDERRLAVAIGDVSGHGLSTGLVMAMVKAAITTLVEENADEISLFKRLNALVYRSTERRAFMTLAFTIFDLETLEIRHTNAGHLYPYILSAGQPLESIEAPSLPLGVRPEIEPHTVECSIQRGDALVYLSDGIIEALDRNGDPFGFDRLESILEGLEDQTPAAIQDAILSAVDEYTGGVAAADDSTVMVLRFESPTGRSVERGDESIGASDEVESVPAGA